ncbi:MAG: hypothetical protein SPH83_03515 [Treponema sp.]|nr:hypothetical protein [Treponema sp.]
MMICAYNTWLLNNALANQLPEQKTQELQKKVDAAVDNIIRNFSAVRMSTGMTPEEAVKLAVKTVGGKDSAVFVPPASGIVYQTPAMNAPFNAQNGSDKRIFSDIRIADLIEKSKNLPPPTKEIKVERLIAESRQSKNARGMPSGEKETETGNIHAEANRADKPYKKTGTAQETYESFPNLFNKEEREAWYKTESFRKTGLSVSDVENLVQSETEKIQGLKPSTDKNVVTFSKKRELDRKLGYAAESTERSRNALLARIEPVTHSLNAEETAKRLEETENTRTAYTKEDDGLLKERNAVAGNLKVAEINANGRLSRELAGAVAPDDFARERNRIIFGEDVQQNIPAKKGDGKPLNTLANPKAEKTENSPTPYQSARQQAQSQFLTETTEAITASNVSKYTKGGQIFPTDYNSGTESHVSVQEKHGTGTRHNAEIAAGDIPAGSDAGIIGESQFYKESTPSLSVRTEAVHHTDTSVQGGEGEITGINTRQNSSENHLRASSQTKPMPTPEEQERERMARINANYEHDKAVLAKADPLFARNQFWDVGHAEGSGEDGYFDKQQLNKIKGMALEFEIRKSGDSLQ